MRSGGDASGGAPVNLVPSATPAPTPSGMSAPTPPASAPKPATTTTAAAAASAGAVGVPIENVQWYAGNNANLATLLIKSATWETDKAPGSNYMASAPQTTNCLVLDVEITATKGTIYVDNFGWTATAADGHVYGAGMGMSGNEPEFKYQRLEAGQSASGLIVLDVPQGDVTVTMPNMGDVVATWHIPA